MSAVGFNTYGAKGIVLSVSQRARVDATLSRRRGENHGDRGSRRRHPGGNRIERGLRRGHGKEISQLVLNGRNFTQLISLTPGVSNQTGQDEGTVGVYGNVAWSINGGRTEYNNWELDGGDNMDNGSNGTLNVYPSIDAIAEVQGADLQLRRAVWPQRIGHHGDCHQVGHEGRSMATLTNSYGTTTLTRATSLRRTCPSYKKNDYGYTIGGPVCIPKLYNKKKEKTFFFWSEEWRKDRLPPPSITRCLPPRSGRAFSTTFVRPRAAP